MIFLTKERTGELLILLSSVLWGFFPVITILTFSDVTPLYAAAISTLVSAVFFGFIVTWKKQWSFVHERRAWKGILLTSFYIGILFYGLIFVALRHTTAGNEAIMSLMEVFFSFLILGLLLKHEKLTVSHLAGGVCMVIGAAFILLPKVSGWYVGDLLVILATFFAPIGNKYTQDARKTVSSEFIMFCRSLISGSFLLLLAAFLEPEPEFSSLRHSLGFFVANGVLFLGVSKILWIEGVHRIPITKAVSLESIYPFFTLMLAYVLLHEEVTGFQIAGLIPIVAGIFLLTAKLPRVPSVRWSLEG